jgi:hypothetical protein
VCFQRRLCLYRLRLRQNRQHLRLLAQGLLFRRNRRQQM